MHAREILEAPRRSRPFHFVYGLACIFASSLQASCIAGDTRARSDLAGVDLETLHAKCATEQAVACLAFAEHLFWKDPGLRSQERHAAAEKACRLGEPDGCAIAGVEALFYSDADARAPDLLVKGCSEGSFMACFALKQRWPSEVHPQPRRVVPLLEASCQRGMAYHCEVAGILVISGYAQLADFARGLQLLQAGCETDKSQCVVLAAFHANGKLPGSDPSAVDRLCAAYRRARAADSETPRECPSSFSEFVEDARGTLTPG